MWIIRFHLLQSKDYNKIQRICKKYGFVPRKTSQIVFAKASLLHHTQKKSWRSLASQFAIDHAALYRFDKFSKTSPMLEEIFHVFLDSKIALYIGDNKTIDTYTLNNSEDIYILTKKQFKSMLASI